MRSLLAIIMLVTTPSPAPGPVLPLFNQLNGQPVRFELPDGGASGMFGTGQQCMPVTGGVTYLVRPQEPVNLCERPGFYLRDAGFSAAWDGGCNAIGADYNFGEPLQPFEPRYLVVLSTTTTLCQVSDGGSPNTPVWRMR